MGPIGFVIRYGETAISAGSTNQTVGREFKKICRTLTGMLVERTLRPLMEAKNSPTYLEIATDLIKRWMVYLPLDAVLAIPDRAEDGNRLTGGDIDEERDVVTYPASKPYPLTGLEIPGQLFVDTMKFSFIKNRMPLNRLNALPQIVGDRVFVTEDFTRPLTAKDLDLS